MSLKTLLKDMKLQESTISMLLGVFVILVAGYLAIQYFANRTKPSETLPPIEVSVPDSSLPTKHIVVNGESLWAIAEKYYGTGYNWIDIKEANNLKNADQIKNGDELTIPAAPPRVALAQANDTYEATDTPAPEENVTEMSSGTPTPNNESQVASDTKEESKHVVKVGDNLWKIAQEYYHDGNQWVKIAKANEITTPGVIRSGQELKIPDTNEKVAQTDTNNTSSTSTENYTVTKGDSLWSIAQGTYGDGNKWPEIAKANNLTHPNIIHSGNTLTIPR